MASVTRSVTHDICCSYYNLHFKAEKRPNQPRGKLNKYLNVLDVFNFIKSHNSNGLYVSSVRGRYIFSLKKIDFTGDEFVRVLVERSDKESEDIRIHNRPSNMTRLVQFEDGDEYQRFFHVIIMLDKDNPTSSRMLLEQYSGGTGYTFGYILSAILQELAKQNVQPDFFKTNYPGGGLNEDGSQRMVEFNIKAIIDNVPGITLTDRVAAGNLLSISAIEESKIGQTEDANKLILSKKEFKFIPQPAIYQDQNGDVLEKSIINKNLSDVFDDIRRRSNVSENYFYRVKCKENSRVLSVDIKGDFVESDFGVKLEFIERHSRQSVTENADFDMALCDKMEAMIKR